MIIRTEPQPKKPEQPKKVIALVNDGRTTFVNPEWKLAQIRRDNAMLSEDVAGSMYGNNTQG